MKSSNNIYSAHLPHKCIAVYQYLEKHCNKQKQCFHSINTISLNLNMSYPTIISAIKILEEHGFISKQNQYRKNGGKSSNLYTLKK